MTPLDPAAPTVGRERTLLEREANLERTGAALEAARSGTGRLVRVDGSAGIGKTRLLAEVATQAERSSMTVLVAGGGELERGFPFCVVRQLFERCLDRMPQRRREALLSDAAALAAPLFAQSRLGEAKGDRTFAVLHGLYWLTANLAERSPVAIVVDDAHWADAPSLRFLAYLARRVSDLPVAVVVASRPHEPDAEPTLAELWRELAPSLAITLAPLSRDAVAILVRETLHAAASVELCDACHTATAGNPFYLRELIAALLEQRERGSWTATEIGEMTTERISREVLSRLNALGSEAEAFAEALAVVGSGPELRIAAAVADLNSDAASRAADVLEAAGILAGRPAEFIHPIVRSAVLDGLPGGERAGLHARAAEQLAEGGAEAVDVARHLLESEPDARPEVVAQLRQGARDAVARGVPASAVSFLRRATREPPTAAERPALLLELGRVEMLDRDPKARDDLTAALRLSDDPVEAGRVALLLSEALTYAGDLAGGIEVAQTAIDRLGDHDAELTGRLELTSAWYEAADGRLAANLDQRLPKLRAIAEAGGAVARPVSLLLGGIAALRAGRSAHVLPLIRRGLDGGRFVAEEASESLCAPAIAALTFVDELDELERLLALLQADARRRGSVIGLALTSAWGGYAQLRQGRVAEGLPDTRAALALAQEHELRFAAPFTLAFWAEGMVEAGEPEPAATALDAVNLAELEQTTAGSMLLYSRAIVRAELGRGEEAADDLRRCGATQKAVGWRNPTVNPWRSALAGVIAASQPHEARALVSEELALASTSGQPRAIGHALHARALLDDPADIDALRGAVAELERSPGRPELVSALTDLGAALRRANHRAGARKPLRRALDLAHRGGAVRAAERARGELLAAGGRPRRMAIKGADSLTPSERRVVHLAAEGLSNPEIAQSLFVSRKTVEMHLSNAYSKLEIHSREELPEALQGNRG